MVPQFVCPIVSFVGICIFTKSFFLARRSLPHISPCSKDSVLHLLEKNLGLTPEEISRLLLHQQSRGNTNRTALWSSGEESVNDGTSATTFVRNRHDGCWMDRMADAVAIIVVDALRFDFALEHLPKSVGSRINQRAVEDEGVDSTTAANPRWLGSKSKLVKFVADPPTVTMQRLKGLTTGGLPAFADISNSFGGATVDEDTWVLQLRDSMNRRRNTKNSTDGISAYMAFVGDDTWVDLFPNLFHDCHPFPSFNTRDLDTVDNGCLQHIPRLFNQFGPYDKEKQLLKSLNHIARYDSKKHLKEKEDANYYTASNSRVQQLSEKDYFELIVVHFLGVDHVGHTYGPSNIHMIEKLSQMDEALTKILKRIDSAVNTCEVAFILGDHGMTKDGNHGGGTDDETNAGLFAHFSPGCSELSDDITGSEMGSISEEAFLSIHQIDLVPTISLLLGLPIPFANIGSLVPSLLPLRTSRSTEAPTAQIAKALALNAAQVWEYFATYSMETYALPLQELDELRVLLDGAVAKHKSALLLPSNNGSEDFMDYRQACALYKVFLTEATKLGKRLWTTFDVKGMMYGIIIILLSLLVDASYIFSTVRKTRPLKRYPIFRWLSLTETIVSSVLILFQCALLTFSNSYINSERSIIMFSLSILCIILVGHRGLLYCSYSRMRQVIPNNGKDKVQSVRTDLHHVCWMLILVPCCSRLSEMFVTGHGMDPSIPKYAVHNPVYFILSLAVLSMIRVRSKLWDAQVIKVRPSYDLCDLSALVALGLSWIEKRSSDTSRNGYVMCRITIALSLLSLFIFFFRMESSAKYSSYWITIFAYLTLLMAVTGPSAAPSAILYLIQIWSLNSVTKVTGPGEITPMILGGLWRMSTRHTFFATGHACSFNRLQFSAAFVATDVFYFQFAGCCLFLNTFGWEVLGNIVILMVSYDHKKKLVWRWFCFFQLLEAVCSCISVSLLRRHLMVWAIFAPRFVFAIIFFSFSLFLRVAVASVIEN